MNESGPSSPPPPVGLTFWIIWFGIFSGLMMMLFVVGKGFPEGEDRGEAPMLLVALAAGAAFLSLVVRTVVLPKMKILQAKLAPMMIGLALAEGCGVIAIFGIGQEFPHTKLLLIIASIVCVIAQAPIYTSDKSV